MKSFNLEAYIIIQISVLVLCGMLMTACDVSAIAKPWEVICI